jgi:prepilin-type N-terminal cleavage/methylation domain-containing protein
MKFTMKNNQSGFSLVELMTVVAIIGVLAAIAVPRLTTYRAKAIQSEAKTNLGHRTTMQRSFIIENGAYATTNAQLGYNPPALATGPNAVGAKYSYGPGATAADSQADAAALMLCPGSQADRWNHNADTGALTNDATTRFTSCD